MSTDLEPGAIVAERFRLDRLLGKGGMGTVWAATHTVTHLAVALKFLTSRDDASSQLRQRFVREARAAVAARHPNVVQIYDVLERADGSPIMVMEAGYAGETRTETG